MLISLRAATGGIEEGLDTLAHVLEAPGVSGALLAHLNCANV